MSLRDEMALYTELTGEDGTKVPIIALGHFLWGYEIGVDKGRPKGKWIMDEGVGECSYCHWLITAGDEEINNYCPHCGSRMERRRKMMREVKPLGKWITDTESMHYGECDKCGWVGDVVDNIYYRFCPNCGDEKEVEGVKNKRKYLRGEE